MSFALISAQIPIPSTAEIITFVLILGRVGAAFALAPAIAGKNVPLRAKAILAVFVSLMLVSVVTPSTGLSAAPIGLVTLLMVKEIIIGLAIGLAMGVVVAAWSLAGAYLDLSTGFSYGGVIDPQYGNQSALLQQMYVLLAAVIFITLGGEEILIATISGSFHNLPLDQMPPSSDLLQLALKVITSVFVVGLGAMAPPMIALFLTDFAFGLISRAAPQTQVIALEFPVKIAVAILFIIATLPWMVPLLTNTVMHMSRMVLGGG